VVGIGTVSAGEASRASRRKLAKMVAKSFPLNAVRVQALRRAGYCVGRDVYLGEELLVSDDLERDDCGLTIGDRVSIAQRVLIVLFSHANKSRLLEQISAVRGYVWIGDDAWIGAGAIILPNVAIGERAIVGAGAVVTKDVPPAMVVAGNPARVLKSVDGA
jgi:acetyltransferase-like isoleucine patch superfamily enzyme